MTAMALPEPALRIPPLNQGDHLTREEFERRWELHPEIKKAELINGMVFIEMTVSHLHGKPHASLNTWLGVYASTRPEIEILDNATVRLAATTCNPMCSSGVSMEAPAPLQTTIALSGRQNWLWR